MLGWAGRSRQKTHGALAPVPLAAKMTVALSRMGGILSQQEDVLQRDCPGVWAQGSKD